MSVLYSRLAKRFLLTGIFLCLATATAAHGQKNFNGPAENLLPRGLESKFASVNGTRLHYVRGGAGPAILLIHGFPQDWSEFREVLPRLAEKFTVVAVDLRGVGESAEIESGFDKATLAEDLHQLLGQLGLSRVYVFGHDIGGMVAYSFARLYPQEARGVMILNSAFPGLDPWATLSSDPIMWHIQFHQTSLAESLVAGRQAVYFRYFLRGDTFRDADVERYSWAYRDGEHLRAAFKLYRAFKEDAKNNAQWKDTVSLPIVIGSGEYDIFAKFLPEIAKGMAQHGCTNVKMELIPRAAHYVAEEQPEVVTALITRYAELN
jgi:pimeloyl-ACP methyl ester carboxylesterase